MKVADIEIDDLKHAFGIVRSNWINTAQKERRKPTEAESVTICVLAALEQVILEVTSAAIKRGDYVL